MGDSNKKEKTNPHLTAGLKQAVDYLQNRLSSAVNPFLSESPIEFKFQEKMIPFMVGEVELINQCKVETPHGNFRLDFIAQNKTDQIGIECDGLRYHNPEYDFWRDVIIINNTKIQDIIRVNGRQINRYPHSSLYQIGRWYPWIFGDRNVKALESLSLQEFRDRDEYHEFLKEKWDRISKEIGNFDYPAITTIYEYDDILKNRFLIRRNYNYSYFDYDKKMTVTGYECNEYASQHGGSSLKKIIDDFKKENFNK